MNRFILSLEKISGLSHEGKKKLIDIVCTKDLAKGEKILNLHAVCHHIYFIEKGIARIYYLKKGKDVTEWFAFEDSYCFSIISFFNQTPSSLEIECLENCEVHFIPRDKLLHLCDNDLEISKYFRILIGNSLIYSQVRMESIQFETASERYLNLLHHNPKIIQRVPLQYIASYLGISFETLSRIRAKL